MAIILHLVTAWSVTTGTVVAEEKKGHGYD
jgi:hypothetical protein